MGAGYCGSPTRATPDLSSLVGPIMHLQLGELVPWRYSLGMPSLVVLHQHGNQ